MKKNTSNSKKLPWKPVYAQKAGMMNGSRGSVCDSHSCPTLTVWPISAAVFDCVCLLRQMSHCSQASSCYAEMQYTQPQCTAKKNCQSSSLLLSPPNLASWTLGFHIDPTSSINISNHILSNWYSIDPLIPHLRPGQINWSKAKSVGQMSEIPTLQPRLHPLQLELQHPPSHPYIVPSPVESHIIYGEIWVQNCRLHENSRHILREPCR